MGHIDSGKTTFLDKIKGTSVAKLEAGKITQHIGATEITLDVIRKACSHLFKRFKFEVNIPGLLFIDTPGHSAFDNLRERGGSLADLVILVVDINKGLQEQDIETLEILKLYKVPFIIAANKIDLIKGWYQETNDVSDVLNKQSTSVIEKLDELIYNIVGQLYNKGFQSERFDRVSDFKKEIAIIPTSAEKGWGIPEAILFLSALSQKFLGKKITVDETQKAQGTILESGEIKGLGHTADVIVYQGILRVKDKIAFLSKQGLIKTKIKALLKKNIITAVDKKRNFESVDFVSAASGVKVVAPELNKCIPGSIIVSEDDTEAIKYLLEKPIGGFQNTETEGAFVKADTLGSLEALIGLLQKNNITIARADIGDVTQKDLLELSVIHELNKKKAVFILFNVGISKELEQDAEKSKITIFKNNIIYKLIEDYKDWLDIQNKEERNKLLKNLIFPCKLKVLKNCIFRVSKPAIIGVKVLVGKLVPGVQLYNKKELVGEVVAIQSNGKSIDNLEKDKEAAISVKGAIYLKNFKEEDELIVRVPLDSIKKLEQMNYEFTDDELNLLKNN